MLAIFLDQNLLLFQDKKSGKTPLMYAIEKKDYNLVESVLRLFEPSKLKNIVKSATFDGSSCIKIAEGLKNDYQPDMWKKLWSLLNSAYNGQIPASLQAFWVDEDCPHKAA